MRTTKLIFIVIAFASVAIGSSWIPGESAFATDSSEQLSLPAAKSILAEPSVVTPPRPPVWNASVTSMYFDMRGTQGASDGLYSFGNIDVTMEIMNLRYDIAPGWTLSLTGTYFDNYVQTYVLGTLYRDRTTGFGDTVLSINHLLLAQGSFMLLGDGGVSLPTGSIDEMNQSLPGMNIHYPYNMQLGSGTFDGVFGVTALKFGAISATAFQTGARLGLTERQGANHDGYRLGNTYRADAWFDVPLKYGFTPRLVGQYRLRSSNVGDDNTIGRNPGLEYYYHNQIDWNVAAGLKYQLPLGKMLALNGEMDLPLMQGLSNSDDCIVKTNFYGSVGVSGQF